MGFDIYGNAGNYFRANVWSWRPILELIREVNDQADLRLELSYWGTNTGAGLNDQQQCNALADALEAHVAAGRREYVVIRAGSPRIDSQGKFLGENELAGISPYRTDAQHILEFVKFLRECGGSFKIC